MKTELMYFLWSCGSMSLDNTYDLNSLLRDGWTPVRESRPSDPCGEAAVGSRLLLVLLAREALLT